MNKDYFKDFQILQIKKGYITDDQHLDTVYLLGQKEETSPYISNIKLVIQDSKNNNYEIIPSENSGYNPTIMLDNFTDNYDDILLVIDSGGSGNFKFAYIYGFKNNEFKTIFDFEKFNKNFRYQVNYLNDYQVEVISENLKKKYIIDIRNKEADYLNQIYFPNGQLKKPIQGFVNGLNDLYPIDIRRDGKFSIVILQKVVGLYNADSLGLIVTILEFDKKKNTFTTSTNNQYLLI